MASIDPMPEDSARHLHGWPTNPSPELRRALADEIASLLRQAPPRDAMERHLVEQVALHTVRLRRLRQTLVGLIEQRERTALARWEAHRAAEAATLMDRLADPEASDAELAATVAALRHEASGCDALIAALDALTTALDEHGRLSVAESRRALQLFGRTAPPSLDAEPWVEEFWYHAAITRVPEPASARARFEQGESRDTLAADLARTLEELTRLRDQLWTADAVPERAQLAALARAQTSPDAQRLTRVIDATDRLQRRAIEALERYRQRPA